MIKSKNIDLNNQNDPINNNNIYIQNDNNDNNQT